MSGLFSHCHGPVARGVTDSSGLEAKLPSSILPMGVVDAVAVVGMLVARGIGAHIPHTQVGLPLQGGPDSLPGEKVSVSMIGSFTFNGEAVRH